MVQAADYLCMGRAVQQMTWAPGQPQIIERRKVAGGGLVDDERTRIFNQYKPPLIKPAPGDVSLWLNHVVRLYGTDADHILDWFAHRVQRPGEKINHGLVLGGAMGVGKDTILEPLKRAVGPWNFDEVSPSQLLGRFCGHLKSVVLRISELRDSGDVSRYQFHEHCKTLLAAPPDVLKVDEKNMPEYLVPNVVAPIFTTNARTNGLYIPADDRRHYVVWTDLKKEDFTPEYWNEIWGWYDRGGFEAVAHFLMTRDLSKFYPKAPPPKTAAFWAIVDAGRSVEHTELADALDRLGRPAAVTIDDVSRPAVAGNGEFHAWLRDRKNRRQIPYRFDEGGYLPVRNPYAPTDGLWKIRGHRQAVYARKELNERLAAAQALTTAVGAVGEIGGFPLCHPRILQS